MAREKRTKPCGNCKRSKLKCEYTDNLPCVRCVHNGMASTCQFQPKLPSLKLPLLQPHPSPGNYAPISMARPQIQQQPQQHIPQQMPQQMRQLPSLLLYINLNETTPRQEQHQRHSTPINDKEIDWKSSMELKMDSFDLKFNDLIDTLKENQKALVAERELNVRYSAEHERMLRELHDATVKNLSRAASTTPTYDRKRSAIEYEQVKRQKLDGDDFRDTVLTFQEAQMLFTYFDTNISQQLFGFEILKFSLESIWETSPILICAICTIALMHYPDPTISSKQDLLQTHLHKLCTGLLFMKKPKTEREGFNTIVALVLCSFWLSDSQRFTGLALQLAKEFGMNNPSAQPKGKDSLSQKDRLKLWYLLYVLDGQQSMTLNRQALITPEDYSLKHSRDLLLPGMGGRKAINGGSLGQNGEVSGNGKDSNDQDGERKTHQLIHNGNGQTKTSEPLDLQTQKDKSSPSAPSFTDLRLVSQVEYNQALNEAFKGSAWDLIAPSGFGIPSKSNLDLDKWMVSWTVLLAPLNNGSVWLSKSTLIYYNFAKMHINSSLIRQLQVDTGDCDVSFPNWDNIDSVLASNKLKETEKEEKETETEKAEENDFEDDDFLHNSEIVTQDQALLNMNIAMNAAQTVLNLVLNDEDILSNLKYVPVHIHIMLYYAAILLANRRVIEGAELKDVGYFQEIIRNLRTVKTLQKKISLNFPTDKHFGDRLIKGLENVFLERLRRLKLELTLAKLDVISKAELLNEISVLLYTNSQLELIPDSADASSMELSPKPERISAWPGSHHGHP